MREAKERQKREKEGTEGRNDGRERKVERSGARLSASECRAALCHLVLTCSITHIAELFIKPPLDSTHTRWLGLGPGPAAAAAAGFSRLSCILCCVMVIC